MDEAFSAFETQSDGSDDAPDDFESPAIGLGFNDPTVVLSAEDQVALSEDLRRLAQRRREAEAASGDVRLP